MFSFWRSFPKHTPTKSAWYKCRIDNEKKGFYIMFYSKALEAWIPYHYDDNKKYNEYIVSHVTSYKKL